MDPMASTSTSMFTSTSDLINLSFFLRFHVIPNLKFIDLSLHDWYVFGEVFPLLIPHIHRLIIETHPASQFLKDVCYHEANRHLRWMLQHLTITHSEIFDTFQESCQLGHLSMACRLNEHFRLLEMVSQINEKSRTLSHQLFKHFHRNRDQNQIQKVIEGAFLKACENDHLEVVRWLSEYILINHRTFIVNIFNHVCRCGHIVTAQWLVEHYQITTKEIKKTNYQAFQYACRHGHLTILIWLIDCFKIKFNKKRDMIRLAFQWACEMGHLDVAGWLIEHFDITIKDLRLMYYESFITACEESQINVIKWLTEQFDVTFGDALMIVNMVTQRGLRDRYYQCVKWLIKRYRIPEVYAWLP